MDEIKPIEVITPGELVKKLPGLPVPTLTLVKVPDISQIVLPLNTSVFEVLYTFAYYYLINRITQYTTIGGIMEPKKWYTSKTIWVNGIVFLYSIIAFITPLPDLSPEALGIILGGLNMLLRLITKKPVVIS